MKKKLLCALIISLSLTTCIIQSQNQINKWYFGTNAGLDFMTNPPTALTNGSIGIGEGCATMSDVSGNLLFYSQGTTVRDQNHMAMPNGIGMFGNPSSAQGVIFEKQPGNSNLYYMFTVHGPNPNPYWGANYSIIDMSLAAGLGSVTVANEILAANTTEGLTSTRHCNGMDTWVITHEHNSANFKTFLLNASGVNTVAVVSTAAPVLSHSLSFVSCMRASPNGKKLALSAYKHGFHLYDFDNATGLVSNPLTLFLNPGQESYGLEFSADGSKLYGSTDGGKMIYQWDLCAGADTDIVASMVAVYNGTAAIGSLQRASNGKIYAARVNQSDLGIINSPNLAGNACNYVDLGISIAPRVAWLGLPNFNWHYRNPILPFTYTLQNCSEVAFSTVVPPPGTVCAKAATYSLIGQQWDFGDPVSGSANISTLSNPVHLFSAAGSYTTQLVLYYSCGGGTDTLRQVVAINNPAVPNLSVSGAFTICAGGTQGYTVSGANTYSWSTGASTQSIVVSPALPTGYTVTGTGVSGCSAAKAFTVAISACTALHEQNSAALGSVNIFPNPNSGYVYVECALPVSVLVIDQQGRVILKQAFDAGLHKMDTGSLSNGLYFLQTISAHGSSTGRFIKTAE